MAAITVVSSNPVQRGPTIECQMTGPVIVGMSLWSISRKRYSRTRYEWSAKGGQSSRDLPSEQHSAVGTEYLTARGFDLQAGAEFSVDGGTNVWGIYWEEWEDYLGKQYWDGDSWENI